MVVGSWKSKPGTNVDEGHRVLAGQPDAAHAGASDGPARPRRLLCRDGGDDGREDPRARYSTGAAAPVDVGGRRWGAVVVTSGDPAAFDASARNGLAKFASLVGVRFRKRGGARAAHRVACPHRPRRDEERLRLERNLHDGAQQRLVALSLAPPSQAAAR